MYAKRCFASCSTTRRMSLVKRCSNDSIWSRSSMEMYPSLRICSPRSLAVCRSRAHRRLDSWMSECELAAAGWGSLRPASGVLDRRRAPAGGSHGAASSSVSSSSMHVGGPHGAASSGASNSILRRGSSSGASVAVGLSKNSPNSVSSLGSCSSHSSAGAPKKFSNSVSISAASHTLSSGHRHPPRPASSCSASSCSASEHGASSMRFQRRGGASAQPQTRAWSPTAAKVYKEQLPCPQMMLQTPGPCRTWIMRGVLMPLLGLPAGVVVVTSRT
mmetsp:Transcript_111401/g.315382  ORF Transcript_111401/g.315382 Transcript_111401/m.315382 type:complete len:274 (-) Transcript_111401:241-1062(-)